MQARWTRSQRVIVKARAFVLAGCAVLGVQTCGCWGACGLIYDVVFIRGRVIDAATSVGLSDVTVRAWTLTGGERTGSGSANPTSIEEDAPTDDGSFEIEVSSYEMGHICTGLLDPPPYLPELPPPDQIELIVVRDGCEQSFVIEINEDTVVDLDFPDDVVEFKDPILVPPCEE